ncbi:ParB/RepB/Spo0J family partition protein [Calditrichota bacterium]
MAKLKNLGRGLSALIPDADDDKQQLAVQTVPVRNIKPNPQQPRRTFRREELEELTASIAEKGVIQPLIVRTATKGFELIAGERRLRAAKLAGLTEVPVRVLEVTTDLELLELSLIENLQRHDLNPIELAEGYHRLSDEFGLKQDQIATVVGKQRATVANSIRMLELPAQIRESIRSGEITTGHAKAILTLKGAARQSALWKRILSHGLSVRQTEEVAKGSAPSTVARKKRRGKVDPPEMQQINDRLRRALATQVHIHKRGNKGEIRVEFYNDEDLTRLVDLLSGDKRR